MLKYLLDNPRILKVPYTEEPGGTFAEDLPMKMFRDSIFPATFTSFILVQMSTSILFPLPDPP